MQPSIGLETLADFDDEGLIYKKLQCKLELCILSAVKACLIIVGARPTASQLVACIVTSLSYQP